MKDYYKILGVSNNCEDEVITAAYKAMMKKYHPDTSQDPQASLRATEINEAYEVLKNPLRRKEYDAKKMGGTSSKKPSSSSPPPPPTPSPSPHNSTDDQSQTESRQPIINRFPNGDRIILGIIGVIIITFFYHYGSRTSKSDNKPTDPIVINSDFQGTEDSKTAVTSEVEASDSPAMAASSAPKNPTQNNLGIVTGMPELAPREQASDKADVTVDDRRSMESACSTQKHTEGAASYNRCLQTQMNALTNSPRAPNMSGATVEERRSMESACSTEKYTEGAASYNRCLRAQMNALANSPRAPNMSGVTVDERRSMESACSTQKYTEGAASYNRCLRDQMRKLGF